ncbi:MAG: hypothetical protein R3D67_09730 [Hyphomicrobiaceae bacterium]
MSETAQDALETAAEELRVRAGLGNETNLAGRGAGDDEPDLIEIVRYRLELLPTEISDVSIAASLARIGAQSEARGRWLAAFGSPLGKHLAARGSDLNTAINAVLALAPRGRA